MINLKNNVGFYFDCVCVESVCSLHISQAYKSVCENALINNRVMLTVFHSCNFFVPTHVELK